MTHQDHRRRPFHLLARLGAIGCLALTAGCGPTTPAPEKATPTPVLEPEPEPLAEIHPRPPADPLRLMGASPGDVQALIGNPTLVRRDDMMQVMLFENDGCVLEVVFYEPTRGEYFEARHLAARTRTGDNVNIDACLASHLPGGHWPDE
ncbi:hypothetical protein [Kordiimonas aestuarii]|uniref:hypothetical protein n=1 Tax=Kordiimonas aestuarii TaxID=1005925 RepID=UPI0021D2753E|nr:hypothetical protein [Kordiimonas aestuarii]